ncbi:cytosolic sulfotransferase 15-like [Chenopodium quinoa]|uniref:cytosolic sulfotransferase 15-like n=1 Tax=Chenopodium quinoa TaxID=63459 RepID=UPI000B77B988|nr:cytosolic sulfotransferase 15-like [Chenopodium quinoa]
MCLYQNFWCPEFSLEPVIALQNHFEAHESDIFVINMPKTGTTWFKSLLYSLLKRSDNRLSNTPLRTHNPHELILSLEITIYAKDKTPDLTNITPPRLFSTHLPSASLPESVKNSKCKIIYVTRNPFDTFVSSWHYYTKLKNVNNNAAQPSDIDEYFDKLRSTWSESLERPEKVLFLKYEDLKEDGALQLKRVAEFVGYPFSKEEEKQGMVEDIINLCSIESLKEMEVNKNGKCDPDFDNKSFFRKGVVGDWVNYLTPAMVERLCKIRDEKLNGSGLSFCTATEHTEL